jgi:hypothetical protein
MRHSTFFSESTLRRGSALVALAASVVVVALLLGTGSGTPAPDRVHKTAASPTSSDQSSPQSLAGQASPVDAGPFAGTWRVHTQQLVIQPDGSGTAQWPIHAWCGMGTPPVTQPCDQLVPDGAYEDIIDGGHAKFQLTAVNGNTAEAVISGATDPAQLRDGPLSMSLAPDDVLTLSTAWEFGSALCGPAAAALTIPQQQAEGINCGA